MSFPIVFNVPSSNLAGLLGIEPLPLVADKRPFRQLEYILQYVRKLGCSVILVEEEYIDRDYMQDHSAFYAASFAKYPPVCRRMHFFREVNKDRISKTLQKVACRGQKGRNAYETACKKFSREKYLGFSVVKPLPGSPVGRTVLRTYPEEEVGIEHIRCFEPTREYITHLLGVELTVRGLGFQQQDQGVSACATTAVWSSLQKLRDFEDVAAATPAQITAGASRFALPYGRSLPSEGLSLDQMCQAIHALGISPNLIRVNTFWQARNILYSAGVSGIASILIIVNPKNNARHAVAAVGLKVRKDHGITLKLREKKEITFLGDARWIDDLSGDLMGIYVHDDRLGPYVTTKFEERKFPERGTKRTRCYPCLVIDEWGQEVPWVVTHLLMPVHGKIRTAIAQMINFSAKFAGFAYAGLKGLDIERAAITTSTRIVRAHRYVEELAREAAVGGTNRLSSFFEKVELSRYVGVTTIILPKLGAYDVLVDTTGTERNAHCLAIICRGKGGEKSSIFVSDFAAQYLCKAID